MLYHIQETTSFVFDKGNILTNRERQRQRETETETDRDRQTETDRKCKLMRTTNPVSLRQTSSIHWWNKTFFHPFIRYNV